MVARDDCPWAGGRNAARRSSSDKSYASSQLHLFVLTDFPTIPDGGAQWPNRRDVLDRASTHPANRIDDLAPSGWARHLYSAVVDVTAGGLLYCLVANGGRISPIRLPARRPATPKGHSLTGTERRIEDRGMLPESISTSSPFHDPTDTGSARPRAVQRGARRAGGGDMSLLPACEVYRREYVLSLMA